MKRITANQFQTSERYYKLPKVLFEDYAKKKKRSRELYHEKLGRFSIL